MARKRKKSKARKKKTPRDRTSGRGASAQAESAADESAQDKSARDKTARDESAGDETSRNESAADESAHDRSAQDKSARDKTARDESAGDETSRHESAEAAASAEMGPDSEPEVIDLNLDEDLDDEAERARLIAEAAGLAADEAGALREAEATGLAANASAALGHEARPLATPEGSEPEGHEKATSPSDVAAADAADEAAGLGTGETAAEDAAYDLHDRFQGRRAALDPDTPTLTPAALAALTAIHREGVASAPGELVLDLGEGTTEEERERLLAAALAHAEMQEAIYRVPTDTGAAGRWKGTVASVLFLLAALVVLFPPGVLTPAPPASLSATDHLYGVRVSLLLQAQQIEAFRAREGRLPDSLAEVRTALPGIRFVKSSNRLYQLVAYTPAGRTVVYDSASPAPELGSVQGAWTATGTGS